MCWSRSICELTLAITTMVHARTSFVKIDQLARVPTRLLAALFALLAMSSVAQAQNDMRYFITRSGDKLMEGDKAISLHLRQHSQPSPGRRQHGL